MNDPVTQKRGGSVRCAIYTRKSSEEGLEQAFNSLDAQREACEAYIKSQKHEGWVLLPELYDDGGISGGTMERPALKRLLADIEQGRVDTVVVYKVDRLTRSLADFSKIVSVFDAKGVSFVSITQQFNTTTSMGRLTLNMLLSFAQFEREVTGERIRDKVAASKKKGMWMGGVVPLGYDVKDRKLVVNSEEAGRVCQIYRLYVKLGSVRLLAEELETHDIRGKCRVSTEGPTSAGATLGRGALYRILSNSLYLAEVHHNGSHYRGEHEAIVARDVWDEVAELLATNRNDRKHGTTAEDPSLLAGMIFDETGQPLTPTHATKGGRRYRYYVSKSLITGTKSETPHGRRIPAGDIEGLVTSRMTAFLASGHEMHDAIAPTVADAREQASLIGKAAQLTKSWNTLNTSQRRKILMVVIPRVVITSDRVILHIQTDALVAALRVWPKAGTFKSNDKSSDPALQVMLSVSASLKRAGIGKRMIIEGSTTNTPDPTLLKLLVKALDLRDKLLAGRGASLELIAGRENVNSSYATRLLRLAFLSPEIVRQILDGRHPPTLTARRLLLDTRLPLAWKDQLAAMS